MIVRIRTKRICCTTRTKTTFKVVWQTALGSRLRLQKGSVAKVNVLVDTSVSSLALRRDAPPDIKETHILAQCLERHDVLFSTGFIVQETASGLSRTKTARSSD